MFLEDENNPIMNANLDGPVSLDPLIKANVNACIGRTIDQLCFLGKLNREDQLTRSSVKTHLSLLKSAFNDLSKDLDADMTLSAELDNALKLLREANGHIRDLEQQMGQTLTGDALAAGMRYYDGLFRAWYERAGFHYASTSFTPWCLQADFDDELEKPGAPDAHCAPKDLFDRMSGICYQITSLDKYNDQFHDILLATDNNRDSLAGIFKQFFPGSRISKFEYRKDRELWTMRFVALVPFQDIHAMAEKCLEKEKTT